MQFRDLNKQYSMYEKEIDKAIKDVLLKGDFIGGEEVNILEKRLAEYVGVKHCITCANGTDALSLVLMAWNIKEGDAVFIPDFTFFATGEVVSFEGATPIFVDVKKDSFNIDPLDLEKKILEVIKEGKLTPRVIIPVDLFGLPSPYPEIEKIAVKYNLLILEDGAQGFGGSIDGKKVGSFGDAATTSFFPAKPLGCYGDGGAIFTNDDKLNELLRSYKFHGKGDHKYNNVRIGINSRLDTIQAAILNVKLDAFINFELESVNKIAQKYDSELSKYFNTPKYPQNYYSSYAQYTLILKDNIERGKIQKLLSDNGVPSMVYYPKAMHQQEAFNFEGDSKTPNTVELCETVISIPIHPYLSEDEQNLVIKLLRDYIK